MQAKTGEIVTEFMHMGRADAAARALPVVPSFAGAAPDAAPASGAPAANASAAEPLAAPAAPAPAASALPPPRALWDVSYRRMAILGDVAAAFVAASLGVVIRFGEAPTIAYLALSLGIVPAWVVAVALARGYERRFIGVGPEEYRAITHATVALVALIAVVSYGFQLEIARGYVLIVFPVLLTLTLVLRRMRRTNLLRQRARGERMRRTVVIGRADSVRSMIEEIRRASGHGLQVVAACVSNLDAKGDCSMVGGVPVFGYPAEALSAVDLFDADVVAVSSHPDLHGKALRRLAWSLEGRQVDLVVAPGILEVAGPRLSIRPAAGLSLLHVERPVLSGARRAVKTLVDRAFAVIIVLLALPVLGAAALAVRLDSPGPILFRQKRVGAQGEEFDMLKFRTMCVDAEERLGALAADGGNDDNAVLFKLKDDPRITRVGKHLRRFSVDELPQLINVLRGEMSLVGPRPPLPREVAVYEPDAVRRLRVQPGLTGLWQVSGRSDLSWEDSLRLDLWYVDNWSLVLDLQILVRTLHAVVRGSGAY